MQTMFTRPRIFWLSLLQFACALAVVAAICGVLYLGEANQIGQNTLDREYRRMEIFTGLFGRDFGSVLSDLRQLSTSDGLQAYLLSGQKADLDRAIRRSIFFSKENPDYNQIRYLDEHGQEIYRVNQNGVVVPADQLQNKADRPYFQKSQALGPGEIYVSALDLNVEYGAVELPLKPMLRFALPVFDANGVKRGTFVINDLAANMIDRLRQFSPQYQQRFRLLNSQGYWLKGAQPEDEWGFMLPDRSGMTMAQSDPGLWAKIKSEPEGQEVYHGGYFTWLRAVPGDFAKGKPVTLKTGDDFLIFASQITPSEWNSYFVRLRQIFFVVGVLLMILTAVATWVLQARRRLQQERDRFFDLTRDMLCVAGFDGYFKRVNPAWVKRLGYKSEELMAKPFLDFVHPEDRQRTVAETARLAAGNEVIAFENRYRCKNGSYLWLLWSARPLVEEQLIYASARDLTERRQSEQMVMKSQQMFQGLFEDSPDAIILVTQEGRINRVNAQVEALFGYGREELIGQSVDLLMPERYRAQHGAHLADYFGARRPRTMGADLELFARHKDGSEFPVDVMLSALETDEGTLGMAVTRNITSRKHSAERIEKLNEELKQRASLLESANRELEAFSYSVSHDLRAPLRHINGFVELLQKAPAFAADENSQRQMGIIGKAARQMGRLIDDLLDLSRTGRAEMFPVKVDMREIIDQLISEREMDCNGRKIEWEIKPLPKIDGDPRLLRLVWMNLIDNALKYTRPRAEAKIEIGHLTAADSDHGQAPQDAVFYVKDNGVGFDMRYASKLFGVFQRLHSAEDFEGTGIGLANVQRIILRHGGRVWAEGELNSGATFYFSLPTKLTKGL
jgi:PAS domain S-box-containing protein